MNGVPLKGYYRQNALLGCYGAALANLLVSLGDADTAKKVFETYPTHELSGRDGIMHVGVATRVVRDLTDGRYEGILYIGIGVRDLELRCTAEVFGERKDKTLEALREEVTANHVRYHVGSLPHNDHSLYWIQRTSGGGHWVVPKPDDDYYIDDGILKWPLENLKITGMMKVKKINLS